MSILSLTKSTHLYYKLTVGTGSPMYIRKMSRTSIQSWRTPYLTMPEFFVCVTLWVGYL